MLTDDELFADISRRKAQGQDYKRPLGELVFRWRDASTALALDQPPSVTPRILL
jgi:hypothetical protein